MDSPMTETDHIKTVYILADGNPSPNVAKFFFTPEMDRLQQQECAYQNTNVYLLAAIIMSNFL